MIDFSSNESEEVQRLKKQLAQSALYLSQLQQAQAKTDAELDELRAQRKALQSSVDKAQTELHAAERREEQMREDRDRRALANANLEQALQHSKAQLAQRDKDRRMAEQTTDAAVGVRERELLKEREALEKRCTTLEVNLREAQATSVYGNGAAASSSRVSTLEQENTQLKSELDRLRNATSLAPSFDSPGGQSVQSRRSRRSSGVNVTGSEEQQLREINAQLSDQLDKTEGRAARAERDALKASNERLASERRCQSTIDALMAERNELKDELKHCNHHADGLERQLDTIASLLRAHEGRADDIEKDVQDLLTKARDADDARAVLQASNTALTAPNKRQGRPSNDDLRDTLSDLATKTTRALSESQSQQQKAVRSLEALQEDATQMRVQLRTLDKTTSMLSLRERELSAARRRLRKLSTVLRKALPSAAGLVGDVSMMTIGGVGEETMAGDMTLGLRGFEADMVDELEQLLAYVEELDGKLEFQRVEHEIQESNASKQCDELKQRVSELDEAFAEAESARRALHDEVVVLQGRVQRRTEQIGRHQAELKQEQMNRKLAEDALKQFVATHEADDTMLSDHEEESKLRQELASKERELHNAEERIVDLQVSSQELQRELDERVQECDVHVQEQRDLIAKVQLLQAAGERLAEDGSVAQRLEKELADQLKQELSIESERLVEAQGQLVDLENAMQQQTDRLREELAGKAEELIETQERAASLESALQLLDDGLKQELASKTTELNHAQARAAELESAVEILKQELDSNFVELNETQARAADLERASEELAVQVSQGEAGTAQELIEAQQLAGQLKQELAGATAELVEAQMRAADFKSASEQRIVLLQQEMADTTTELVEAKQLADHLKKELAGMANELLEAQERAADVESASRQLAERLTNELEDTATKLLEAQERVAEVESASEQLAGQMKQKEATTASELVEANLLADRLKQEVVVTAKELVEAQEKAAERERTSEQPQWEQELADSAKELAEARERAAKVEQELAGTTKELAEAHQSVDQLEAELASTKVELVKAQERVVDLERASEHFAVQVEQELASTADELAEAQRLSGQVKQELAAKAKELVEALERAADLESATQRLEAELSMKAQECEDADDKELALRKDNKRLTGRVAAMQARLDKLQSAVIAPPIVAERASGPKANGGTPQASAQVERARTPKHSPEAKLVVTRKRRNPDEEDVGDAKQDSSSRGSTMTSSSSLDRACVYAPGPTALTTASSTITPELASNKAAAPVESNRLQSSLNRSGGGGGGAKPSDLVAMRLQQKLAASKVGGGAGGVGVVRLADRTNMPRDGSSDPAAATGDSHFMAKLNRYRTPSTSTARKVPPP